VILVDTSTWVDHLRAGNARLARLLEDGEVVTHPYVIGELALGNLRQRDTVLDALSELPQANVATDIEVLHLIREEALFGRGIGYVDVHLLASTRLSPGTRLWTGDRRLREVAEWLGLAIGEVR
jgi:predicted nucleic acid-binding protein